MKPSTSAVLACVLLATAFPASAALVAWYPLDEGAGGTANDASGNGNTMNASGVWLGTGAFGGSMNVGAAYGPGTLLARTGGGGSLAGINATTGNQVSIAFWLKPDSENQGSSPFYIGDNAGAAGNRIFQAHLVHLRVDQLDLTPGLHQRPGLMQHAPQVMPLGAHDRHGDRAALPEVVMVDLGDAQLEAGPQRARESLDHGALLLEGTAAGDAQIEPRHEDLHAHPLSASRR